MKFNVCNLHTAVYKFSHIITEYDLTISLQNTKLVAFKQRDPVRDKIVIDNKIIEQVNPFNYLGTLITYEKEVAIDNILNKYLKITGIIKNMFIPQKTRLKLYNTLAVPAGLYGTENWTVKARDARRVTAAEMKCMRKQQDTLVQFIKELNKIPVLDKIQEYRTNCLQHINKMSCN